MQVLFFQCLSQIWPNDGPINFQRAWLVTKMLIIP
uniref:Uncharacterized protein n=1 Tax=Anguilla anguilla TaxID=7936 RepID=A0A0E9QUT6_ANGAN